MAQEKAGGLLIIFKVKMHVFVLFFITGCNLSLQSGRGTWRAETDFVNSGISAGMHGVLGCETEPRGQMKTCLVVAAESEVMAKTLAPAPGGASETVGLAKMMLELTSMSP